MDEVLPGLFDTGIPDVKRRHRSFDVSSCAMGTHTAIVLMDWVTRAGSPHPLCPRSMLKSKVAEATAMGFSSAPVLNSNSIFCRFPLRKSV